MIARRMVVALGVLLCATVSLIAQNANTDAGLALPLQFSRTAFGQAGAAAGKSFGFTVYITDWTTDQQVNDFVSTLRANGSDGLVKAFGKTKDVGRVSPTGFVGNSFRFARSRPAASGGQRIVMVTDRPMSFWEAYNAGRSTQYPLWDYRAERGQQRQRNWNARAYLQNQVQQEESAENRTLRTEAASTGQRAAGEIGQQGVRPILK